MVRLVMILFGLTAAITLNSQICSTPQEPLLERTDRNKEMMVPGQRGAVKYVPITFHLVAASNGTGRVPEENILYQLDNLNEQYADQEIKFYIDRFNYFDNDAVYNNPSSTAAETQMQLRRDPNSINIYITNLADSGSGTPGVTLAYYSPQHDWIVSRKDQINAGSSTLAHEIGHFFSLAHPHAGWDCFPFTLVDYTNPVSVDFTLPCEGGGGSMLIELHNRSNCNQAGDRICDTPEDYNLGFLFQSGCAQNTIIKDKNGETITPMVNNYMGYYNECSSYAFTQTQKNLINTDYLSIQRNYIRTGVTPVGDPVGDLAYINPVNGYETPTTTNILLDWEDTPGANKYLVIYDRFASFSHNPVREVVTTSEYLITDNLIEGVTYHWKVWPYNECITGEGWAPTQNFVAGTGTGVNEISEINSYFIAPNPSASGVRTMLSLSSVKTFNASLEITDISGQVLSKDIVTVHSGISEHPLNTVGLPAGIYFITLLSENGHLVERLLLLE